MLLFKLIPGLTAANIFPRSRQERMADALATCAHVVGRMKLILYKGAEAETAFEAAALRSFVPLDDNGRPAFDKNGGINLRPLWQHLQNELRPLLEQGGCFYEHAVPGTHRVVRHYPFLENLWDALQLHSTVEVPVPGEHLSTYPLSLNILYPTTKPGANPKQPARPEAKPVTGRRSDLKQQKLTVRPGQEFEFAL